MNKVILAIILALAFAGSAFAGHKDHSAEYKVGTFQSTDAVSSGNFTSCDYGCMTQSTGHNVHYVTTDDGLYTIEAPTNTGLSILQGALVSPNLPDVHIQWFMDDLNPNDKVLFYSECDKHNNCKFWVPKPDQPGKEYTTNGWFRPRVAKTNTTQLCGTGKLSAAVEAQVCQPTTSPQPTVVAPTPIVPVTPSVTPEPTQPTTTATPMAQFKTMCDSEMFKKGFYANQPSFQQQCDAAFPKAK